MEATSSRRAQSLRVLVRAAALALAVHAAAAQTSSTGKQRSDAYRAAVAYLHDQDLNVWESGEEHAILLAEAIAADPLLLGARSTSQLGSLVLSSLDARAHRVRSLWPLGLDVSSDVASVSDAIRPRTPAAYGSGRSWGYWPESDGGTRRGNPLDNAMALQALGWAEFPSGYTGRIQRAITFLVDNQLGDGSWPLHLDGEPGASATGDVLVTAECLRALHLSDGWNHEPDPAAADNARADAGTYLKGLALANLDAAEAALRLMTLLDQDPASTEVHDAVDDLVLNRPMQNGFYEDSVYAVALAAQALLRASAFPDYAFDADGDGLDDASDPNDDTDGFCDPGETDPGCSGTDAFPFDEAEHSDLDLDGVGDNSDVDVDGDGVCDSGPSCADPDLFPMDSRESRDTDGDATGDNADTDDDNDSLTDVEELLLGLDPLSRDTDGDTFWDDAELEKGTNPLDPADYPLPDADIFPLGDPDHQVDLRDAWLAMRIVKGDVTLDPDQATFIDRHGNVAPLVNGIPNPDAFFDAADTLIILRRVVGDVAPWSP